MRFSLLICIFISQFAFAEIEWRESTQWHSSQVLSQGQHSWSFRVGHKNIKKRYGLSGNVEPLGKAYSQDWTWNEILGAEKDLESQLALGEYMARNDILPEDVAAMSFMEVQREELLIDLSWAYGITPKWTFGFFLPISNVKTSTRLSVEAFANTVAAMQSTKKSIEMSADDARSNVKQLIHRQLEQRGFRSIAEEKERWVWGDFSLLNQYMVYQDFSHRFSIQQVTRIPTSRNPSLSDYVQSDRDDGQIDLGLSVYHDYVMNAAVVTTSVGFVGQLPAPVRVSRYNAEAGRSEDLELERNLGDVWWAGAELRYSFGPRLSLGSGYQFFSKGKDELGSGTDRRVSPGQQVQLVRLMGMYKLDVGETRYDIEKNWALNMEIESTVAGKNSEEAIAASLGLQTYF